MSEQKIIDTSDAELYGSTRRAFHLAVVYILGALIGARAGDSHVLYLLVPPEAAQTIGVDRCRRRQPVDAGVPVEMSFQQSRLDGWKLVTEKKTAWVVKEADNKIVAFGPQCTHLGCAYHWEMEPGKFVCPCHASFFRSRARCSRSGAAPARPLRDEDREQPAADRRTEAVESEGLTRMRKTFGKFIEDLDHRTGLHTGLRKFLYEEIPASSGWHQVFGSVALFLILIQFFTGVMLAFNYAPTPGDAYNSLRYILTEVTAGRLMRGLHHWGASMIIVIVVLHMVQVFLWGAYKKPREGTWIVGVVLLLLTLAYGLTGYLLPWDNRAYWGTVVTTQIGATVPVMGPYVSRLLASTGDIGVVTFARFYALHVLLLPPATMLLIALHVYLVRRHGVAPAPGDEAEAEEIVLPGAGLQGHGRGVHRVRDSVRHGDRGAGAAGAHGRPDRHQLHPASRMVFPVPVPDAEGVRRAAGGGGHGDAADARDSGADSDAVYRSQQGGAGPAAHSRHGCRRSRGSRMGRADRGRGEVHSAADGRFADRFLRPDAVDATGAGGTGRRSLLPPGEMRRLPQRDRRHAKERAESARTPASVTMPPG